MARVQAFRYCASGECTRAALWRDRGQKIGQIQPHPACHPKFYPIPSYPSRLPTPHLPILPPHDPPTPLSSHLTTLLPSLASYPLPSLLPYPPTRNDSPRQFQAYFPIFLYSYMPISPPPYSPTLLPPNKTPEVADPPAIPLQRLLGARCRFRVPRRGRRWPGRRRHFAPPAAC